MAAVYDLEIGELESGLSSVTVQKETERKVAKAAKMELVFCLVDGPWYSFLFVRCGVAST